MSNLKKVIIAALMLAATIVLSRFLSIKTPILVISFSYIPIMLCAILLGPWWTMLVAGLADLIGALLFPFGAYFVGYTISATLSGFIYGICLKYKKNMSYKKFILMLSISTLLVIAICNGLLNSLWIYITTKKALVAILPTRLVKELVMLPIQITTIFFLHLGFKKMGIYDRLFNKNIEVEVSEDKTKIEKTKDESSSKKEDKK